MLGGIISVYTAGVAIGALLSGPVGNRFGRLGTIRIGAIIAAIGTTLQTAAMETIMLIFGRLVAGLAIGLIYFAITMFLSEIAPFSRRGLFTGLHSQFIGFGYMTNNWIGFGVSYTKAQFTVSVPLLTPELHVRSFADLALRAATVSLHRRSPSILGLGSAELVLHHSQISTLSTRN